MLGMSLGWQVPGVAAGAATSQATEMVRLINGTRSAAGLSTLATDGLLSSLASNGAYRCGDTPYKAIAGRAQDFAAYNFLDHRIRNCLTSSFSLSSQTFVSVLQRDFGFGNVGEIIAMNSGYGTGAYTYTYNGWTTQTTSTAGHVMGTSTTGWMSSSTHRAIIVGSYNRIGCGAWYLKGGYYYDCLFSIGGGHAWARPAATRAPARAPTKAPAAVTPPPTASPTVSTTPIAAASPSEEIAGIVAGTSSPTPGGPAAAAQLDSGAGIIPESAPIWRDALLRAGLLALPALSLIAAAGLMLRLRRRRGGDPAA